MIQFCDVMYLMQIAVNDDTNDKVREYLWECFLAADTHYDAAICVQAYLVSHSL